jgi:hypothetical protein
MEADLEEVEDEVCREDRRSGRANKRVCLDVDLRFLAS